MLISVICGSLCSRVPSLFLSQALIRLGLLDRQSVIRDQRPSDEWPPSASGPFTLLQPPDLWSPSISLHSNLLFSALPKLISS
ncbi:hypothetical protein L596_011941 [Steinernema carpocapsae]|uniref:Uncharacterized protein n=1 Tax=Steinernema carpocapsae TaxID=34508 RepID=A0A4V6XWE6_STECR|nr:hypothetical protein L596_011941 [Steinernema carpocapsae]